jgi:hypothetical protein
VKEYLRSLELTAVSHGGTLGQSDAGHLKAQSPEQPPPPPPGVGLFLPPEEKRHHEIQIRSAVTTRTTGLPINRSC